MKKLYLSLMFGLSVSCLCSVEAVAQHRPNYGLSHAQASSELPSSEYSVQTAARVEKQRIESGFTATDGRTYVLSEGWELADEAQVLSGPASVFDPALDTRDWYNAVVPGTVLTTLVSQGVYPDPYWGLNNLIIPDSLCRTEWWYRNVFAMPVPDKGEKSWLIFNGVNYRAEVWLNSRCLGSIRGAFSRGRFDVTDIVSYDSPNVLAVKIYPPNNPGIPQEANSEDHGPNGGVLCLDGPTFISSEGWDWVPGIRDRNTGIWQDVEIVFTGDVQLGDTQVITDLPLPRVDYADLTFRTELTNSGTDRQTVSLKISVAGRELSCPVELGPGEHKEVIVTPEDCAALRLENPNLWWPNGYGAQELYTAELSVERDGKVLDSRQVRFGVRELEYELSGCGDGFGPSRFIFNPIEAFESRKPVFDNIKRIEVSENLYIPYVNYPLGTEGIKAAPDSLMGHQMVVRVNGQRILCRGGNWGMDDAMKSVSREKLEPYMKLHKDMNFNMIRNWTGESTQESFYELCDEYGILVFNDFWLSTEGYNLNPVDDKLFADNVRETVRRYRNHPSIALWCPRNEGFAPHYLESQINHIIAREDGTRHYLPSSIKMNTEMSGPWSYINDPGEYYSFSGGFRTEVGSPSLPTAEMIRKMMAPEDVWPIGDVWYYHDWLMGKWGDEPFVQSYHNAIISKFGGEAADVDEFADRAQLLNYESYRAILESWNSKMWHDASGILLWMSHPAWKSLTWQTYSRDCETSGAYFGCKKACTPVHIQMTLDNNRVDIINTTLSAYKNLRADVLVYDVYGKVCGRQNYVIPVLSANSMESPGEVCIKPEMPGLIFVKLALRDASGTLLDDNTYWVSRNRTNIDLSPFNSLGQSRISVRAMKYSVKGNHLTAQCSLRNDSKSVALGVRPGLRRHDSGEQILPVFFSDGYFTLMPGESKQFSFEAELQDCPETVDFILEPFNARSKVVTVLKCK